MKEEYTVCAGGSLLLGSPSGGSLLTVNGRGQTETQEATNYCSCESITREASDIGMEGKVFRQKGQGRAPQDHQGEQPWGGIDAWHSPFQTRPAATQEAMATWQWAPTIQDSAEWLAEGAWETRREGANHFLYCWRLLEFPLTKGVFKIHSSPSPFTVKIPTHSLSEFS